MNLIENHHYRVWEGWKNSPGFVEQKVIFRDYFGNFCLRGCGCRTIDATRTRARDKVSGNRFNHITLVLGESQLQNIVPFPSFSSFLHLTILKDFSSEPSASSILHQNSIVETCKNTFRDH